MRKFGVFRNLAVGFVCLGFTGVVANADPRRDPVDDLVPQPAPNSQFGSTVRAGTSVGFVYGAPAEVIALGGNIAVGQRFGRLGIEAEYTYLGFLQHGQIMSNIGLTEGSYGVGHGSRLAAIARLDVIRFGPTVDKRRSLITFYVEGGAAVAWNHWSGPSSGQIGRIIPDDTKRTEAQAGAGLMIFPHRVAWLLGWRFAMSPHEPMTGSICRGVSCKPTTMPDTDALVDRSMLFQSSLEFTF
jgi:hypothetical protein